MTDTRLNRVTEIALALPEAEREAYGSHFTFSVRGRKFAYFLENHHGDGIVGLCIKAAPGENTALIASDALKFYMPAYIGPRGWVGQRLDVGDIDRDEVRELTTESYLLNAPRSLARLVSA